MGELLARAGSTAGLDMEEGTGQVRDSAAECASRLQRRLLIAPLCCKRSRVSTPRGLAVNVLWKTPGPQSQQVSCPSCTCFPSYRCPGRISPWTLHATWRLRYPASGPLPSGSHDSASLIQCPFLPRRDPQVRLTFALSYLSTTRRDETPAAAHKLSQNASTSTPFQTVTVTLVQSIAKLSIINTSTLPRRHSSNYSQPLP